MLPNIHPACASLPVALLFAALIASLLSIIRGQIFWSKVACYNCCLACLGILAAFFSGYWAVDGLSDAQQELVAVHHAWGKLLLWVSILSTGLSVTALISKYKQVIWHYAFLISLTFALLLASYTAFLGGGLVFEHAIGVRVATP